MNKTHTMKDLKDRILKILFENSTGILEGLKYGTATSEIESLIKENYVEKEFVIWSFKQDYWRFSYFKELWVNDEPIAFQEEMTLDELHDYWLKEVKSKQEIK